MVHHEGMAAEGMSSLQGHVGSMGSMPLVAILLVFFLTLSACRSHRQRVETIALSQRQSQQMLYHDTLWQSLSLQLEGVTIEWHPDSISPTQGTIIRAKAERAELSTQRQARTELKTEAHRDDTLATHQETVETQLRESTSAKAWRVWGRIVMLLVVLAVSGYLGWHFWRGK